MLQVRLRENMWHWQMSSASKKTQLHEWHVSQQARIVDFAGWSMPVQYTSIVEEHHATRTALGVFDISHMGRLRFDGPDAARLLDRLVTRRVLNMPLGKIRYALVTNEHGGILDDVLVYHLNEAGSRPFHMLVVNAGNRDKIVRWIAAQRAGMDVTVTDRTEQTAMIAVQGPRALAVVQSLVQAELASLAYYEGMVTEICGLPGIVSRTGYTGEDGCEFIVPGEAARSIWEAVLEAGSRQGARPAGLGARDTLRLEAAMPLYGHELSEAVDPFQAGLDFAVQLPKHVFVGHEALARIRSQPLPVVRIGLTLAGKRVPRERYLVFSGGEQVGEITSGTFSPTRQQPIAMAYVRAGAATPGQFLDVDIRGRLERARVVQLPFYVRRSG